MYLTARVVVTRKDGVLSLPMETVLSDGDTRYVYVVTNGNVHRADIVLGLRGDDHYEIIDGLQSGDVVVTGGASNLSDNSQSKNCSLIMILLIFFLIVRHTILHI